MSDAQKFVKEFEASPVAASMYGENRTLGFSTVINIHNIQGEFADVVRTRLNTPKAAPVTITKTVKDTWNTGAEEETWDDEVTLRVEAGEESHVFHGTSYYGVIGELVEWLAAA